MLAAAQATAHHGLAQAQVCLSVFVCVCVSVSLSVCVSVSLSVGGWVYVCVPVPVPVIKPWMWILGDDPDLMVVFIQGIIQRIFLSPPCG